jgi:hypothetical protein
MRPIRSLFAAACLFACLVTAGSANAQNPFSGTWKINQDKSQMAGDLLTFAPAEGQAIELTAGGTKYSFRVDGNTYRLPSGNAAIWRAAGANRWTTEYRKTDGKLLSNDTWQLSADGKNLSVISSGVKANGDLYTDTEEYVRTAGTDGSAGSLIGSWKGTQVKLSSPSDLTIEAIGLDGVTLKIAAIKAICVAKFDGKDTAVQGPDIPPGFRLALTRTGPYSFKMVQKLNGSPISSSEYTVSEDGKTMTEIGNAPGDPPSTTVWEKQ